MPGDRVASPSMNGVRTLRFARHLPWSESHRRREDDESGGCEGATERYQWSLIAGWMRRADGLGKQGELPRMMAAITSAAACPGGRRRAGLRTSVQSLIEPCGGQRSSSDVVPADSRGVRITRRDRVVPRRPGPPRRPYARSVLMDGPRSGRCGSFPIRPRDWHARRSTALAHSESIRPLLVPVGVRPTRRLYPRPIALAPDDGLRRILRISLIGRRHGVEDEP
jgi:hypothetical protein